VVAPAGLRNGEEGAALDNESQRNLPRRRATGRRDGRQHATALRARPREGAGAERTVGHDGHAVLHAPGDDGVLDGALLKMVEDLIARDARAGQLPDGLELGDIEVADTPAANLAVAPQLLEGLHGALQRMLTGPVQQVAVESIGLESRQRALAGRDRSRARRILRKHLGDEEDLVAAPADRLRHQLFGGAGAVHLGGIDVRQAEVEAASQRGERGGPAILLDVPGPLPDDGDVQCGAAEPSPVHARQCR